MNVPVTGLRRIILACLAILSGPALAATDTPFATETVSYADLDLANAKAIAILYRRINNAAEKVCGPATLTGSQLPRRGYRECVSRAVTEAVSKLDRPELAAYHARKEHHFAVPTTASAF